MDEDEANWWDRDRLGDKLRARLPHWFVPVEREREDIERYACWDLATIVSSRCGVHLVPEELEDSQLFTKWAKEATEPEDRPYLRRPFALNRRPFWLMLESERIGITGFAVQPTSLRRPVEISLLYLRPQSRRLGWGSKVLNVLRDTAFDVGFERVYLGCEWTNQPALQFYLSQSMWVQSFKDYFKLFFHKGLPRWSAQIEGTTARFLLDGKIAGIAENRGDRLEWQPMEGGPHEDLSWDLEQTAALQLALLGWPLIRSDKHWQKTIDVGVSDCGDFEALAHRIRRFERYYRSKGWQLPAPNPSFVTLARLARVEAERDRFLVFLSDGRQLSLPFEVLDPMPTEQDPLEKVEIVQDEIVVTLHSGARDTENVDRILGLNQSPEHMEQILNYHRQDREARRKFEEEKRKQQE